MSKVKGYAIVLLPLLLILVAASIFFTKVYSNRPNVLKKPITQSIKNTKKAPNKAYQVNRFPGEFEKQQAIWMQWPSEIYNSNDRPINPVVVNIIKAFVPHIQVNLMARDAAQVAEIQSLLRSSGYEGNNVRYYIVNHLSIWARDVGPIFMRDKNNKLSVADFGFNNYSRNGNQDYINTENQVDRLVGNQLGIPVVKSSLISEGGAIESNGKGTLMTTEAVALARNPGLSKKQIEDEYKRVLGVQKVIWLKKGLAEDDTITTGHINEFARFVNSTTILLGQVSSADRYANAITQESYRRLEENYTILKNSTDQNGKHFKIIRVPMPPTVYGQIQVNGSTPVLSYLNYAVTNGVVLVQSYWKPGRSETLRAAEQTVKGIFQKAYPCREIIGIDTENLNLWGGGIHCITQHMPAR